MGKYGEEGGQSPNIESLIKKVLSDEESRKEQEKKIDRIEKGLTLIGDMLCDSKGNCQLATREDLAKLGQEGEGLAGSTKQDLWDELKSRDGAIPDMAKVFVKKLKKDEDLMRLAAEDEAFREKFLDSVCTTPGCRKAFNEQIEKAQKAHPEEEESWLAKK